MRKPAKPRSLGYRFAKFLFTSVSAMAIIASDFIIRNPVMSGGATAFMVVLGFVSANALWYQPEAHDNVFFRTRPELVFKATPRPVMLNQARRDAESASAETLANDRSVRQAQSNVDDRLQSSVEAADTLPALAPGADIEVAQLQQKLAALGLYSGTVDGLPGPQTRKALEQWNAIQERAGLKMAQSQSGALAGTSAGTSSGPSVAPSVAPEEDEIAQAIAQVVPTAKPARSSSRVAVPNGVETATTDATTTAAPSRNEVVATAPITVSSQDIVRVQAGLKAFGNDLIQVDGVAGRTTQDAIREFQKLFGMQVSGNVDAALVGKMREIGLIS